MEGPGPRYNPSMVNKESAPAYSMGGKPEPAKPKDVVPGPNAYKQGDEMGKDAPAFTMAGKHEGKQEENPGPAAYDVDEVAVLPSAPAFTLGRKIEPPHKDLLPGPGRENACVLCVFVCVCIVCVCVCVYFNFWFVECESNVSLSKRMCYTMSNCLVEQIVYVVKNYIAFNRFVSAVQANTAKQTCPPALHSPLAFFARCTATMCPALMAQTRSCSSLVHPATPWRTKPQKSTTTCQALMVLMHSCSRSARPSTRCGRAWKRRQTRSQDLMEETH